ncbi:OB-fold-containig protein [Aestuariibacter sp. A3R04]|uniref:OB-fold-containig protein n=1 Tax=Aestuariibacter sp. A3R04 TaxID=2841571 RepID=UPI001C0A5862|nr:OB-fold-containig protein [Aestuariibacter sp. A3R04]MBU3023293.1 YqiJ family protein [Aestuariibacter sp. A3R04]
MSVFLLNDANFLFTSALCIVVLLFLLEAAGLLFGTSFLGIFDDLPEVDTDPEVLTGLSALTNWLALNKLPVMVWFILFLTIFGITGIGFNMAYTSYVSDGFIPPVLGVPLAMIAALPLTGRLGGLLARLLPKNDSSALKADEFAGSVAVITIGIARSGSPAEAKFTDHHAQPHYVLVEPFEPHDTFNTGDKVILVKKTQHSWLATRYV